MFDRLDVIYTHIHTALLSWIPPYLAEMGDILDSDFYHDRLPEMVLPLLSCKAAGGDPEQPQVMRCATAVLASLIGLHILDDIRRNHNRQSPWQRIGAERAAHYAFAFQTLSDQLWVKLIQAGDTTETVYQSHRQGLMIGLAGRNRSYSHNTHLWDEYWKTVEMSLAQPGGHLAAVGAMLAGAEDRTIEDCRGFGHHLSLALHILAEYKHLLRSNSEPANGQAVVRLPIIYALKCDHPDRKELEQIVTRKQLFRHAQRITEILAAVDVKSYLLWAILEEKKRALESLDDIPESGKQLLEDYLMGCFANIPGLEDSAGNSLADTSKNEIPVNIFNPDEPSGSLSMLSYDSVSLGLRNRIRLAPEPNPENTP